MTEVFVVSSGILYEASMHANDSVHATLDSARKTVAQSIEDRNWSGMIEHPVETISTSHVAYWSDGFNWIQIERFQVDNL